MKTQFAPRKLGQKKNKKKKQETSEEKMPKSVVVGLALRAETKATSAH